LDNSGKEGAPGAASTGPGAVIRSTEGSQRHEVVFIIFLVVVVVEHNMVISPLVILLAQVG